MTGMIAMAAGRQRQRMLCVCMCARAWHCAMVDIWWYAVTLVECVCVAFHHARSGCDVLVAGIHPPCVRVSNTCMAICF